MNQENIERLHDMIRTAKEMIEFFAKPGVQWDSRIDDSLFCLNMRLHNLNDELSEGPY